MQRVALRNFPYPFRAALTICSDIDGTKTAEKFLAIQDFLATGRQTEFGPGLSLEIGNSFFPITRDDSFSYLSSRPRERAIIRDLIRAGYIDCIHSYEYGVHCRQDILRVLDELVHDDCRVDVWINHSRSPSNFHTGGMFGFGDVAGSPYYHADASLAYGIRFVWLGRATCLLGQERRVTPRALRDIYDPTHARETVRNASREAGKILAANLGHRKFAIHRDNRLLRPTRLLDGQPVHEFNRWNNYWSLDIPDSRTLAYLLQSRCLDALTASQGYAIIYTHLGRGAHSPIIPPEAQAVLRDLAARFHQGEIYVATTSRLLRYCLVHRHLDWSYTYLGADRVEIRINHLDDPACGRRPVSMEDLQGITFHVPNSTCAAVFLGDSEIEQLIRNPRDETGLESVMIPRTALAYPFA